MSRRKYNKPKVKKKKVPIEEPVVESVEKRVQKVSASRLRYRIKENFSVNCLDAIDFICNDKITYKNNNDKVNALNDILIPLGFSEIGAGTNRYCVFKDGYIFKIALDNYGKIDNDVEFDMCPKLIKFGASKTYECNSLIAVAEYLSVLSKEEFISRKVEIGKILHELAKYYLFSDLGTIVKNFRNWGKDDNDNLKFIDYGYIFERDELLLRCTYCLGPIGYDSDYDQMKCSRCKRSFSIHDIKTLMNVSDKDREKLFEKKNIIRIEIDDSNRIEFSTGPDIIIGGNSK